MSLCIKSLARPHLPVATKASRLHLRFSDKTAGNSEPIRPQVCSYQLLMAIRPT